LQVRTAHCPKHTAGTYSVQKIERDDFVLPNLQDEIGGIHCLKHGKVAGVLYSMYTVLKSGN
jgi:hypothetical protein